LGSHLKFPRPTRREKTARVPIARKRAAKGSRTSGHRKKRLNLKKRANDLWSKWVKRDGLCQFVGEYVGSEVHKFCAGSLQAMHGFPKGAYPSVRYAAWNGFSGCGKTHAFYSWREPEWQNWLRKLWGNDLYELRLREAVTRMKPDLSKVIEVYSALLAEENE